MLDGVFVPRKARGNVVCALLASAGCLFSSGGASAQEVSCSDFTFSIDDSSTSPFSTNINLNGTAGDEVSFVFTPTGATPAVLVSHTASTSPPDVGTDLDSVGSATYTVTEDVGVSFFVVVQDGTLEVSCSDGSSPPGGGGGGSGGGPTTPGGEAVEIIDSFLTTPRLFEPVVTVEDFDGYRPVTDIDDPARNAVSFPITDNPEAAAVYASTVSPLNEAISEISTLVETAKKYIELERKLLNGARYYFSSDIETWSAERSGGFGFIEALNNKDKDIDDAFSYFMNQFINSELRYHPEYKNYFSITADSISNIHNTSVGDIEKYELYHERLYEINFELSVTIKIGIDTTRSSEFFDEEEKEKRINEYLERSNVLIREREEYYRLIDALRQEDRPIIASASSELDRLERECGEWETLLAELREKREIAISEFRKKYPYRQPRQDVPVEIFEQQGVGVASQYAPSDTAPGYADGIFGARFEGGMNSIGGTATARLSPRLTAFAQSRLRFTDGVGDSRDGVEGGIRAGISRVFTERFSGGFYALAQFGDQQTSTSTLDSRIAGGGLFGRYKLSQAGAPVSLTAGFGAMWEHGTHDFSMGGATGSFGSDRYSVQGQLSASTRVEDIDVSLNGNVDWSVLQRGGFTMSDATDVAANRIETLDFSMSLGLSRTIAVANFGSVATVTPSLSATVGYAHSSEAGYTVDGHLVEFDGAHAGLGGGVALGFFNGATLNLTASAKGLATDTRRYVFNGNLRVPLN